MKPTVILFFLLLAACGYSQAKISGRVADGRGKPVIGANVYINGTYDGAFTDENGDFSFETTETGIQMLVITFLAFEDFVQQIDTDAYTPQTFTLKENVNMLDTVVISAGTFQAGDNSKVTALKIGRAHV